eukprot:TRINITY_DN712_c6_g1_i1.p1 TRINITY_DN712_c6_g1~~TRINITY_DN712_c6_g1_i1.p1  ORF type:complete len:359 (+),score=45.41 TRINITY_DN712_c6_g1_i1:50-1126(+)
MLRAASRGVLSRSGLKLQNVFKEAEPLKSITTGGGNDGEEESRLSMTHAGENRLKDNSLPNREVEAIVKEASREIFIQQGSVLSAKAVGAVARLQSSLLQQKFTTYQCLRVMTIFRKILSKNIMVDGTVYVTMLRVVCARGGIELDMTKSQVATALEEVLMAAHKTFKNSPIPLIEGVLPTYIRACVGLNIPYSLRIAGEAISELKVDNDFGEDSSPVVFESLENISLNLYNLTEMWRKMTFRNRKLRVITKRRRVSCQQLAVSKYHYMVLQNLQSLFHELEAATNRFRCAHDAETAFTVKKVRKSKRSCIDSDSEYGWISSVRDVSGHDVWRKCLVNGPYNRKIFRKNVKIPDLSTI